MKEREIIEALRANEPFQGLRNVRMALMNLKPPEPFDVEFDLKFGDNQVTVYAEIKDSCTPKQVQQIAPWLARLKDAEKGAAYALICPSISPQVQSICDENNIDFIDLAGNLSINVPGKFLLRRTGLKAKTNTRLRFYRDPFSGKSSRVLRVLLQRPGEWTLKGIAKELRLETQQNSIVPEKFEISLASISRTLRSLEEELLVRRRGAILVPEPKRLLFRWAEKYKERYRSYLRTSFKCLNPFGADLRLLSAKLSTQIGQNGFALTGAASTAITAPFVDIETIDVFVSTQGVADRMREIEPQKSLGPDIRVIFPYDEGVFMYARLVEGIPLVSDLQAYLDLFAQGGRDLKQADYLLENRIEPQWRNLGFPNHNEPMSWSS
jgi:hypothetical protein